MGTFTVHNENQKELDDYIARKWREALMQHQGWAPAEGVVEVKEGQILEGEEAEAAKAKQEAITQRSSEVEAKPEPQTKDGA